MGGPIDRAPHPWNDDFTWVDHRGPFTTVTEDQAAAFDRDGYFVLPSVFDPSELDAIRAALAPGIDIVTELLGQVPGGRFSVAGLDTQIVAPNLVPQSDVLRATCEHPVLAGVCLDLVGPDVRLYWEQAVYKQPGGNAPVLWHQDNGYTYVDPQAYLTCWIALTEATPRNGCIEVMPGIHRQGTLVHRETDLGFECWGDHEEAVEVPVQAGDVVVFSSLTPHATRANGTDVVREAYIVQYAHDGAVARPAGPDGARGAPRSLDDPDLQFPVVVAGRRVALPA